MLDIRHYRSASIKCAISGVSAHARPGTVPKLCAGTNYVLCSDWCPCSGTKSHGALESVLFIIFVIFLLLVILLSCNLQLITKRPS